MEALLLAGPDLAPSVVRALSFRGYEARSVPHVAAARAALAEHAFRLVIVDEAVADWSKLTVEAATRAHVIVVAAGAATEAGARAAIQAGADDYVARPASPDELSARLFFAERAMAERTASAPRRSLLDLVEHSPIGIARIQESDGQIIDANPELCRILGLQREDIDGAHAQFLFTMVEPASPGHPSAALGRRSASEPFIVRRLDQKVSRVLLSSTRYEDDDGWYTLLILHDVTEREQLRKQLLLAERMSSLGMLAAGVAHEINNPLSYTTTNLQFIAEMLEGLTPIVASLPEAERLKRFGERDPIDSARTAAAEALEGAGRVREIVKQLRDFSRSDETALELVSVEHVIERALALVANELRHRARVVTDYGETGRVLSNPGKLGQIIVNLLVNASQAIDGRPSDNEIRVSTRREADRVSIEVSDTGRGIPTESLERIFEPFFTTKAVGVGTGLGLSICHALATALGGTIEARSGGRGATFRVTLPASDRAGGRVRDDASDPQPMDNTGRRARILVVDDEPSLGRSLRRALQRGHDVVPVTSAQEALGLLASGERFDLILCDVMMPDITGIELFATIKATHAALADKVIFITGGAFTEAARTFLENVSNERLLKPIDIISLRRLITDRMAAAH